jgi:DNA-binding NarL/FixJ family response regulator
MIRVVLVDDQELVRVGLRTLLGFDGDIEVVGEASDGASGANTVRVQRPDVVLMDLRMPGMDGLEATRKLVADPELDGTAVVVLTTFDEDEDVLAAVAAGASGYLLKDVRPQQLREAVRTVAAGESLLDPSVTATVMEQLASRLGHAARPELLSGLTEREVDVLTRVGLGESNQELALRLFISAATARTYVSRLLTKTGCRDRSQLVVLAYESGLVAPGRKPA